MVILWCKYQHHHMVIHINVIRADVDALQFAKRHGVSNSCEIHISSWNVCEKKNSSVATNEHERFFSFFLLFVTFESSMYGVLAQNSCKKKSLIKHSIVKLICQFLIVHRSRLLVTLWALCIRIHNNNGRLVQNAEILSSCFFWLLSKCWCVVWCDDIN